MDDDGAAGGKKHTDLILHATRDRSKRRTRVHRRDHDVVRILGDFRVFSEGDIMAIVERPIGQVSGTEERGRSGV